MPWIIDQKRPELSVARQCALMGLSRASYYYRPVDQSAAELLLLRLDEQWTKAPCYGVRQMTGVLRQHGYVANSELVCRLLRECRGVILAGKRRRIVQQKEAEAQSSLLIGWKVGRCALSSEPAERGTIGCGDHDTGA